MLDLDSAEGRACRQRLAIADADARLAACATTILQSCEALHAKATAAQLEDPPELRIDSERALLAQPGVTRDHPQFEAMVTTCMALLRVEYLTRRYGKEAVAALR